VHAAGTDETLVSQCDAPEKLVDFTLATVLLIASLPLLLAIAVAIRMSSRGPILFRQERIGLHNRPFTVVKFRSMVDGAEDESGPVWAAERDPRVTRIGRWLRRWRLDEPPQSCNVIKRDMSLVRRRPERSVFVNEFLTAVPM